MLDPLLQLFPVFDHLLLAAPHRSELTVQVLYFIATANEFFQPALDRLQPLIGSIHRVPRVLQFAFFLLRRRVTIETESSYPLRKPGFDSQEQVTTDMHVG